MRSFRVYTDDLLVNLSNCDVRCFIESDFVGALAYADDTALLAPTPSVVRKVLTAFASENNIVFYEFRFKL
jgi:hypothetical protein